VPSRARPGVRGRHGERIGGHPRAHRGVGVLSSQPTEGHVGGDRGGSCFGNVGQLSNRGRRDLLPAQFAKQPQEFLVEWIVMRQGAQAHRPRLGPRTPSRTHLQGGVQQARNVGRSAQNRNGKVGEPNGVDVGHSIHSAEVPLHGAPLDIVRDDDGDWIEGSTSFCPGDALAEPLETRGPGTDEINVHIRRISLEHARDSLFVTTEPADNDWPFHRRSGVWCRATRLDPGLRRRRASLRPMG